MLTKGDLSVILLAQIVFDGRGDMNCGNDGPSSATAVITAVIINIHNIATWRGTMTRHQL